MSKHLRILNVEPTIFFVKNGTELRQQVRLAVENGGDAVTATLALRGESTDESLTLGTIQPGVSEREVYLPDIRSPGED